MPDSSERLNKVLARLGYGSRRAIDALISQGKITVNGAPAQLGQKVCPRDTITLSGRTIEHNQHHSLLLAFHKPKGVTTTKKDRFAKVTVMNFLPPDLQHLYPVGRLDRESRGLLLLTNDGLLANRLMHPRYHHEKEYQVTVLPTHQLSEEQFYAAINRLTKEVIAPHAQTKPVRVSQASFSVKQQRGQVTLILEEGRKRQIRQLFHRLGFDVVDLFRTRIANYRLTGLKEGEYVTIDKKDVLS